MGIMKQISRIFRKIRRFHSKSVVHNVYRITTSISDGTVLLIIVNVTSFRKIKISKIIDIFQKEIVYLQVLMLSFYKEHLALPC